MGETSSNLGRFAEMAPNEPKGTVNPAFDPDAPVEEKPPYSNAGENGYTKGNDVRETEDTTENAEDKADDKTKKDDSDDVIVTTVGDPNSETDIEAKKQANRDRDPLLICRLIANHPRPAFGK